MLEVTGTEYRKCSETNRVVVWGILDDAVIVCSECGEREQVSPTETHSIRLLLMPDGTVRWEEQ